MTREQFTADASLCRRLNELITDPVYLAAQEIAMKEVQPYDPKIVHGDLIQQAAILGMKVRGANAMVNNIQSLTNPAKTPVVGDRQYDDAALQALIKEGYTPEQAKKAMDEHYSTQA